MNKGRTGQRGVKKNVVKVGDTASPNRTDAGEGADSDVGVLEVGEHKSGGR